ncbi:sugar ABC transporter ATP-binding protein [Inquilinus sp. OTU3971]|uniref:sugar ABC transporter ATP-binding protein n=1 Tax=Inquilinus sp. OTU3971 TaxID=3043855 RepID=UPI00313AF610
MDIVTPTTTRSPTGGAEWNQPPVLEARALRKSYGPVVALDGVDFTLHGGEVRALLGKNGAGKSTLVRLLAGAARPDAGEIAIAGQSVRLMSPADARLHGISTVYQELTIVPELTVAENIFLGRWAAVAGRAGFIDHGRLNSRAEAVLQLLGLAIAPTARTSGLSIAHRQVVEIARGIAGDPRVLILDEPTSSLPPSEVDLLLKIVARLSEQGIAIVYVSHRMDEIPRVADSITILKDGRHVTTRSTRELSTKDVIRLMTGGFEAPPAPRPSADRGGDAVLSVTGLTTAKLRDVHFEARRGEILGLAGLLGSGRTELLRAIYGLDPVLAGEVRIAGRPAAGATPRGMIALGVGFAPEDRKREGLVTGMSISGNLVLSSHDRISRFGFVSPHAEDRLSGDAVRRLSIKLQSLRSPASSLSGGNQQKVVLGKWLNAGISILLLDEPTRGVDIEAKNQIYALLRELAAERMTIVVASSEIEELFFMCDRLIVLSQGKVVAERKIGDTDPEDTMRLAMEGVAL